MIKKTRTGYFLTLRGVTSVILDERVLGLNNEL